MKLMQAWGAKLKVSLRLSPHRIVVAIDSRCYIYTCAQMRTATLIEKGAASIVLLNSLSCGR